MADARPSILFVGESPPPKAPPDFSPFDCDSGTIAGRDILGFRCADARALFLEHCPRTNIFRTPTGPKGCPPWDATQARWQGGMLLAETKAATIIALGRQAAEALGMPRPVGSDRRNIAPVLTTMWKCGDITCLYLPHPSGQSKVLRNAATRAEVRRAVMPEVVAGIPTLRPWHFELGDPAVLADLGAALCPMQPDVGIAAALVAADLHRHHEATYKTPLAKAVVDSLNSDPDFSARGCASLPTCPAHHPMRNIAEVLARHAGARTLAESWDLSSKRIESAARSQPAGATFDRAALRATIARYVAWGML